MEIFYTAYIKPIQGKNYYFVKKYLTFPEYPNVADILEGYGMHTDFNRACNIACVHDEKTRARLLNEAQGIPKQAKLVEMTPQHRSIKSSLRSFFSKHG
ncbi:MAG: hypothetical protein JWQ27_1572 [Ferruginibacter sp.]|nr:hypothetical protein [Ferruginibacter sp.]